MALEDIKNLGRGGEGFHEGDAGAGFKAVKELQGVKYEAVTGAAAGTKMDVADLRQEDTIIAAVVLATGADDKANITIEDLRAKGTITVGTEVEDDTVTVDGIAFTFKDTANYSPANFQQVEIGADANATAANLAAAINRYESVRADPKVTASAATNVVTITAKAEGTDGNSITLAETGTSVTVSGATLSGGSATGGFKSTTNLTGATVMFHWLDKNY